jgi:hypothetical protein
MRASLAGCVCMAIPDIVNEGVAGRLMAALASLTRESSMGCAYASPGVVFGAVRGGGEKTPSYMPEMAPSCTPAARDAIIFGTTRRCGEDAGLHAASRDNVVFNAARRCEEDTETNAEIAPSCTPADRDAVVFGTVRRSGEGAGVHVEIAPSCTPAARDAIMPRLRPASSRRWRAASCSPTTPRLDLLLHGL